MIDPAKLPPGVLRAIHRQPALTQPGVTASEKAVATRFSTKPTNDTTPSPDRAGTHPELERAAGHAALGQDQGQEGPAGRVHLRIVSVRKRLLDPDNLSPKWLIDCLRYCGAINGDEPDKISLETTQRKAGKGEEEHTIIEITTP